MSIAKMKDGKRWYVSVRYKDWNGQVKQHKKEGFARQSDAKEYERKFLEQKNGSSDMTIEHQPAGKCPLAGVSDWKIRMLRILVLATATVVAATAAAVIAATTAAATATTAAIAAPTTATTAAAKDDQDDDNPQATAATKTAIAPHIEYLLFENGEPGVGTVSASRPVSVHTMPQEAIGASPANRLIDLYLEWMVVGTPIGSLHTGQA